MVLQAERRFFARIAEEFDVEEACSSSSSSSSLEHEHETGPSAFASAAGTGAPPPQAHEAKESAGAVAAARLQPTLGEHVMLYRLTLRASPPP